MAKEPREAIESVDAIQNPQLRACSSEQVFLMH